MDTIKMQATRLPNVGAIVRTLRAANTNRAPGDRVTVPEMRAAVAKVLPFVPPIPREDPPDDVA